MAERLVECGELQDAITAHKRSQLVGTTVEVLVDRPGQGRSHREAPEIDGVVQFSEEASRGLVGRFVAARVTACAGPDLEAEMVA
jgi:tRNA A37 methylthiotransferase MiaB